MSALLFSAALLFSVDADAGPRHRRPPARSSVVIGLPGVTVRVGGAWRPDYRPAPRAGYVWVDGYWAAGAWVPGHWRPAVARPGMVWVIGHWSGDVYVDGYWRPASRAGYVWTDGYYDGGVWIEGDWRPTGPEASGYDNTYSAPPEVEVRSYEPDPGYDSTGAEPYVEPYAAPVEVAPDAGGDASEAHGDALHGADAYETGVEVEAYERGYDNTYAVGDAPDPGPYEAYRQDDAPLALPAAPGADEAPEDSTLDEDVEDDTQSADRHHGVDF